MKIAAALVLLAACGPRPAPPAALRVDTVERSFTIRASRSTVRPLEPSAAPVSQPSAPARPAPQRTPQPSTGDRWARLRQCESGGDYHNRHNPTFRGAYQFSAGTWQSVGGTGDPADAAPAEQDMRAQLLYQRRGAQPWPVCGRYLR